MPIEEELPTDDEGNVVLPSGETIHPDLFADTEETLLEHRGGEEGWRNRMNVGEGEPITPYTARESVLVKNTGSIRHAQRSRQARTADESFNAPIAPDYATWRAHPDRYDLPHVDTIPDERLKARAGALLDRAQRSGVVHQVEQIEDEGSFRGQFTTGRRRVRTRDESELMEESNPAMRPGPVLAHEVGHAIDHARASAEHLGEQRNPTGFQFFSEVEAHREKYVDADMFAADNPDAEFGMDRELLDELYQMTERARGKVEGDYRQELREMTADALGLRFLEPRAVERDYPTATEWLDDVAGTVLEEEA